MIDKDEEIKRLTELLAELTEKYKYMCDVVFKFRNNNSELIGRQIVLERELKTSRQRLERKNKAQLGINYKNEDD